MSVDFFRARLTSSPRDSLPSSPRSLASSCRESLASSRCEARFDDTATEASSLRGDARFADDTTEDELSVVSGLGDGDVAATSAVASLREQLAAARVELEGTHRTHADELTALVDERDRERARHERAEQRGRR